MVWKCTRIIYNLKRKTCHASSSSPWTSVCNGPGRLFCIISQAIFCRPADVASLLYEQTLIHLVCPWLNRQTSESILHPEDFHFVLSVPHLVSCTTAGPCTNVHTDSAPLCPSKQSLLALVCHSISVIVQFICPHPLIMNCWWRIFFIISRKLTGGSLVLGRHFHLSS